MKERPILFSAPMVVALLDGRKAQTRRIFKPERMQIDSNGRGGFSYDTYAKRAGEIIHTGGGQFLPENWLHYCPYGQPGDQLWVRETWAEVGTMDPGLIVYRADYPACVPKEYQNVPPVESITWKPSIHMFRKDSRILLEAVSVRVERLQDISEEDAYAEGISAEDVVCSRCHGRTYHMQGGDSVDCEAPGCGRSAADEYRDLWNSINSNRPTLPHNPTSKRYARVKKWLDTHPDTTSWDANPWVWVVEFRRLTA